jgi:GDP-L-fucose synthase
MRLLITGASGFVGKNLAEVLEKEYELFTPSHGELELLDEMAVGKYISKNSIDTVIHCANRGGSRDAVGASRVVEDNLRIFFNLARHSDNLDRLLYFGSGAEYGKHRPLKKIREEQIGEEMPKDDYGFYKYVCNKYAEKSENIYNLRLFGIYGKYENYLYKFISNTIVKRLFDLKLSVKQNVVFDYLYIADLVPLVRRFLQKKKLTYHSYNLCPDESVDLLQLCNIIDKRLGKKDKPEILNPGLNLEYTGNNFRLKKEFPEITFTSYEEGIADLIAYYQKEKNKLDEKAIRADPYLEHCKTVKA